MQPKKLIHLSSPKLSEHNVECLRTIRAKLPSEKSKEFIDSILVRGGGLSYKQQRVLYRMEEQVEKE